MADKVLTPQDKRFIEIAIEHKIKQIENTIRRETDEAINKLRKIGIEQYKDILTKI